MGVGDADIWVPDLVPVEQERTAQASGRRVGTLAAVFSPLSFFPYFFKSILLSVVCGIYIYPKTQPPIPFPKSHYGLIGLLGVEDLSRN